MLLKYVNILYNMCIGITPLPIVIFSFYDLFFKSQFGLPGHEVKLPPGTHGNADLAYFGRKTKGWLFYG